MARAKTATPKDIDLNRWCIEMAMQWPVITTPGSYGAQGGLGALSTVSDADVLGRANKIMAWVKTPH